MCIRTTDRTANIPMIRKTLVAIATLIATAAGAQTATPDVRIDRVATGVDSMQIYLVRNGQPMHVGMLWDALRRVDHAGSAALRREYRTENRAFGPEHMVYVYRLPGLTPVSIVDHGTSPEVLEFRADSVVGWTTATGQRRQVAVALGPGVYDGTVFDLMIRAGDLRDGWSLAVPAYLTEVESIVTLSARVTGSERVQVEGGRMTDTWVVQMDFAGLASTLWIDKGTRALARQTIDLMPGVSMLMDRLPVRRADERQSR
jgi:hypothetical protein